MTTRNIIGGFLVLVGALILWLFPALATPRHGVPYDGQDLLQFHQIEMEKKERSETIVLRVCVTAGIFLGIGLTILFSVNRKTEEIEPAPPAGRGEAPRP